jgi:hypothetical protein
METALAQRAVAVSFDANTNAVAFAGSDYDKSNGRIDISASEIGLITFQLQTAGVVFPSNPVQWVDAQFQPVDPPAGATVTRTDNASFNILVVRSQVRAAELHFYVLVYFRGVRGRFFGTDPTIVTMSSGGGSGQHS